MIETPDSKSNPGTYLATERTFLAWIRTGIALMGFGFVVARFGLFLHELAIHNNMAVDQPHNQISMPVGILLIVAGVVVNIVAAIRHCRMIRALDRGQFRQVYGLSLAIIVAGFLAVIGLAVAVYLAVLL